MCPDSMPGPEELAANLLNVPVRLYHGELDTVVPVASSRAWQRRLLDAGVPAAYTEYPATRHNVWDMAYSRGGALEWLAGLHRNRWPERVRLVARSYQSNSAYWVPSMVTCAGPLACAVTVNPSTFLVIACKSPLARRRASISAVTPGVSPSMRTQ